MNQIIQIGNIVLLVVYSLYSISYGLFSLDSEKPILHLFDYPSIWLAQLFSRSDTSDNVRRRILETRDFKLLARTSIFVGVAGLFISVYIATQLFGK